MIGFCRRIRCRAVNECGGDMLSTCTRSIAVQSRLHANTGQVRPLKAQ
jgi:hypothetical protein